MALPLPRAPSHTEPTPMTPEQQHQWNLESFRSMAETGKSAQMALLTIVGGSAAALLSFVGVLADKPGKQDLVTALMQSLAWIAGSLLAVLLMSGLAYFAQGFYKTATFARSDVADVQEEERRDLYRTASEKAEKRGGIVSAMVAISFFIAVVLWVWGAAQAIRAGQHAARQTPSSTSVEHGQTCPPSDR